MTKDELVIIQEKAKPFEIDIKIHPIKGKTVSIGMYSPKHKVSEGMFSFKRALRFIKNYQ